MTRGYQPEFDIDRDYGDDGELYVRQVLKLDASRIEVKRKRRVDAGFYVELTHDPGALGNYKPSGVARTKATYYAFVIADTGVIVLVPVSLLRKRLAHALG